MILSKTKIVTVVFMLFACIHLMGQDSGAVTTQANTEVTTTNNVKSIRLGVKTGVPSIITLNAEYLSPILDNRVAFAVDYFPLSITVSDIEMKQKNFELGSNVYLNNKGKGLYLGLSYYNFNTEADVLDVDFDDGTFGEGSTSLKFNTINVKLGVKLGDIFYSRIEIGYGFGSLPNELVITSTDGNSSTVEPIEDISVLSASGLPVFNIGFGFSFL